jgi:K+-sensing histidine kinase KdpD
MIRWEARVPSAFAAAIGFAVMLTLTAVLGQLRHVLSAATAFVVLAVAVALCASFMGWAALLFTAGFGWLLFNGFVVDGDGTLHWHGGSDLLRLAVLLGSAIGVAALRSMQLRGRVRRANVSSAMPVEVHQPQPTRFGG